MKNVFLSFSAAFAAIPGVAVLVSGLSVPPDSKLLFGGLLEAFGALALLMVYTNKSKIKKLDLNRLNRLCAIGVMVSLASLFAYVVTLNICIVKHLSRNSILSARDDRHCPRHGEFCRGVD